MTFETRMTTPAISANPLQRFVTLKQARRAAKGAAIVSVGFAVSAVISIPAYLAGRYPHRIDPSSTEKNATLILFVLLAALFLLLGWRIWKRPGVPKIGFVLMLAILNLVDQIAQFTSLWGLIFGFIFADFSVIAMRGAQAARKLSEMKAEVEAF